MEKQVILFLLIATIMATTGRRLSASSLQPKSAIGYQKQKGGPTYSYEAKENIVVDDDDEDLDTIDNNVYQEADREMDEEQQLEDLSRTQGQKVRSENTGGLYQGQQELLGMMASLMEQVAGLQHTMVNLKLQNHYIYKSIKKNYRSCKAAPENESTIKSAAQVIQVIQKPTCPPNYIYNKDTDHCYTFTPERISWRMAREHCLVDGSDLVSIETKSEQRWLNQQARQNPDTRHCDFWTGGSDKNAEGTWRWVATTHAISYVNWNHNEPNNGRGDEHCLQMLWVFNWAWNDAHCTYHDACYICETEPQITRQ